MQPPGYVPWAERWPSRWKPSAKRMTATTPSSSPSRTTTFDLARRAWRHPLEQSEHFAHLRHRVQRVRGGRSGRSRRLPYRTRGQWPGAGRSGGARADDRGVTQTSKVQKLGIYPKRSLRSLAVSSSGPAFSPLSPTRRSGGRPSYCGDIIRAGARATSGNSPGSTPIRNRTAPQLCARASWKAPSSRRNITSRAFALRATSPQPRLRKPRRLS